MAVLGELLNIPFFVSVGKRKFCRKEDRKLNEQQKKRIAIRDFFVLKQTFSECADLLRKMLTVNPSKRATLAVVTAHRWFVADLPPRIRDLLRTSRQSGANADAKSTPRSLHASQGGGGGISSSSSPSIVAGAASQPSASQRGLDPTVTLFMQQHTLWTEDRIAEVSGDRRLRSLNSEKFDSPKIFFPQLSLLAKTDY